MKNNLDDAARHAKRMILRQALTKVKGNISQAARNLGVSRHRIDRDPELLQFATGLRQLERNKRALLLGIADAKKNLGPQQRLNEATRRSPRGAQGKV